ncbi:YoaK family protein [Xanthomonas arboricola]
MSAPATYVLSVCRRGCRPDPSACRPKDAAWAARSAHAGKIGAWVEEERNVGLYLPRRVWLGATVLGFTAGIVNAAGYLGFKHQALSHLTGTASLGALAMGAGHWRLAAELAAIVISFVGGGLLVGLVLRGRALSWRYVGLLCVQAALLLAACALLGSGHGWGGCLAAAACGLQNAMTTFYNGSAIRTTHLTGFFTDLGLLLGQGLRGEALPWRRLSLGSLVLAAFLAGGVFTATAFGSFGFQVLLVPAALVGSLAAGLALHLARHGSAERPVPASK